MNYVIDNDHTLELSSLRGGPLESGDKIDLSLKNPQVLLLPKTAGGTGTLVMEFVREGVSRKKAVVFRTENAVTVSPSGPDAFPIRYLYKGTTCWHSDNQAARCAGKGLLVYGARFRGTRCAKQAFPVRKGYSVHAPPLVYATRFQGPSSPYSNNFRRLSSSGFS